MYRTNIRFGGPLTQTVKLLLITNGIIFIIQQIAALFIPGHIEYFFGLSYKGLFVDGNYWQIFTYMVLHGSWFHILFNMLSIWMFAGEIELVLGQKKFILFYILSGLGAGLFISIMNYFAFSAYMLNPVTIGASGAIYALFLAYGITWPEREVLIYFLFPVKIKYLLIVFGLIEFFGTLSSAMGSGGNISHIGHLGGLVFGFFIFKILSGQTGKSTGFFDQILKRRRLEKKQKSINERIKAKEIIDTLLVKIAKNGIASLSPEERKMLDWARKNYYPDNNETVH